MAQKNRVTFIGGSSSLNILGEHCYAYSGLVASANASTEKTYLLFSTPDKIIKGMFDWSYSDKNNGENTTMMIFFNNVQVFQIEKEGSELHYNIENEMIIPPLTEVKATLQTTSSANPDYMAKFTGKLS